MTTSNLWTAKDLWEKVLSKNPEAVVSISCYGDDDSYPLNDECLEDVKNGKDITITNDIENKTIIISLN